MKRQFLSLALLMVSMLSFAEWTKPAAPAAQALSVGTECYLYNLDAEGFLLGANDYGTRASYSATLGHKIIIEDGQAKGSYYITNYVLAGGMANQWGYMFREDGNGNPFVDNTKDGKKNNQFTFTDKGDNVYYIGLSSLNSEFTSQSEFFGGIKTKNDTRLYFCEEGEDAQLRWIFVTPADYASFLAANEQYAAAVTLGKAIEKAKSIAGTDESAIAAAEAVYNNEDSTTAELMAAVSSLEDAIRMASYNLATVENPVEVLSLLGIATDFNNGANGWTSTTGAANKGASNGNNAADFAVTGNHYENWHWNAFTPGKISATANGIPSGVYRLNALAYSNTGAGAYLYAGIGRTLVTSTKIDVKQSTQTYAVVTGNSLEVGLDIPVTGPNWVGLDNVGLYYLGTTAEAMAALVSDVLQAEPNYDELYPDGIPAQASVVESYNTAKSALQSAKTIEALASAYADFMKYAAALSSSVKAYAPYISLVAEAKEWLGKTTAESAEVEALSAYIYETDEPAEGAYNGNGASSYILENLLLGDSAIAAELTYLDNLYTEAKKNAMSDGDDVTSLLVNPNFSAEGGWTAAAGINWPTGSADFPVFDAWGRVCDVYQTLSGLQNGLYEMNLQAVYSAQEEGRQTYAYINDFETKISCVGEGETVNTSDLASAAFKEGKYPVKVYGLVTDGNIRVGIANRLRTNENAGLYAGGVTLTFRAKNAEALTAMLEYLTPKANELKDAKCGENERAALQAALENATEAEDKYTALIQLKAAFDSVTVGVELYQAFEVALFNLEQAIANADEKADKVTIKAATEYFNEKSTAYEAQTIGNQDVAAAIDQLKAYTVAIKLGNSIASEENPVDYTSAIVNNNFDPANGNKDEKRIDGWVVEGALNGYKSYSCSFNKGTFKLYQELSGLPAGKYKVTVNTYYRAGSYEEEAANINEGKDTHLMKFYANTSEDNYITSIMNLSEGSKDVTLPEGIGTKEINGIIVPDGTSSSVKCYEAGLFLNELEFTVGEDGKATIGLYLNETIGSNDYTVVGPWHLYYMGKPATVVEQDYTEAIVNNNFDPEKGSKDEKRIDGWVVEGALNGYKSYSCSFNKGTFNLYQELSGLPAGKYRVTVNTYYRAGSYEEEAANINEGKDTHLMKFYANTSVDNYITSIMNLSEGSKDVTLPEGIGTKEINGIIVPDGTSSSVKCYEAGLFLNELEFVVGEDGKATIGLRLDETIGSNDYTVVGPWHLYYYGASGDVETAIVEIAEETTEAQAVPVAFYSINGVRLSAPQRGMNIIKMSNGRTLKVMVK